MYRFPLVLDDRQYNHIGISKLTRAANIMEDGNGGWTLNGQYRRSIIGTLYNYSFVLYQQPDGHESEYDEVYEILTEPTNTHKVRFPYGQDYIELTVYVTSVSDGLVLEDANGRLWGAMQVNCMAQAPSRLASGV